MSATAPPISLTLSQRAVFLASLRDAPALVLRDGESFREASTVLEHIGQIVGGKIGNGLKDHEEAIVNLRKRAGQDDEESMRRLFNVVREARNMAVHEGAYARYLNGRLVDLMLLLEEAIMTMERVEYLMVRTPVAAEPWHLISPQSPRSQASPRRSVSPSVWKTGCWMICAIGVGKCGTPLTQASRSHPCHFRDRTFSDICCFIN